MKIQRNTTASFDIDPQKGFTPLCPNELPVEEGHLLAPLLNEQAKLARLRVVSKDAHPTQAIWKATDDKPIFSPVSGENVDIRWHMHCVPGTAGFELIDGLPKVCEYDYVVYKGVEPDMHPYGACYHDLKDTLSTGVIEYLRQHKITTVICGGLATDYCVKLTALQLAKAGFAVVVNLKACRGIASDTITAALGEMRAANITVAEDLSFLTQE
ncbi:MAG: isochorismatase family protein [Cellvibrionaceae bacterium]|nr:isochorismatase family protein [Cellvibrionaceae bacterium]